MQLGGGVPIEPRPNIEDADVQSGLLVRLAWPSRTDCLQVTVKGQRCSALERERSRRARDITSQHKHGAGQFGLTRGRRRARRPLGRVPAVELIFNR